MDVILLSPVGFGILLAMAFIGIIVVVWNCSQLEKRIIRLEEKFKQLGDGPKFIDPLAVREWTDEEREALRAVLKFHMLKGNK